jgi:hypothetical protein
MKGWTRSPCTLDRLSPWLSPPVPSRRWTSWKVQTIFYYYIIIRTFTYVAN